MMTKKGLDELIPGSALNEAIEFSQCEVKTNNASSNLLLIGGIVIGIGIGIFATYQIFKSKGES